MWGVIEAEVFRPNLSNNALKCVAMGALLMREKPDIYKRPWCARITGISPQWGLRREFIRGTRDYTRTNNVASRGTFVYYAVPPGVYEICRDVTWRRYERFFFQVYDNGDVHHITREEVDEWLKNTDSALAS